jgi:hypothetical protein
VVAGTLVVLNVAANGSNPVSYQWYQDGTAVDGATESSLRISNVSATNQGTYHVVLSNSVSTVTSDSATVVVNLPPGIATQPVGQTVEKGKSAVFTVEVTGTAPFTYQWQHDGVNINGATGETLTLDSVEASDDGEYAVIVKSTYGAVASEAASLNVLLPLEITVQPNDTHVAIAATLNMSVVASGSGPYSYQWYYGSKKIDGATESELVVTGVARSNSGTYHVKVSNTIEALASRDAEVIVDEPISINFQPFGADIFAGDSATLFALASGSAPMTFQWLKDGVAIEGKTANTLVIENAVKADEGFYSVIIANTVGFELSDEALVLVNAPPTIEKIDPIMVSTGDSLEVQVVADDEGDLSQLRFLLQNKPESMTISKKGLIQWVVDSGLEGNTYKVRILVIDQDGLAAGRNISVTVNHTPEWVAIGAQTVKEQNLLGFIPVATDSDDTNLVLAASDLPTGATYDAASGFSWLPTNDQVGAYDVLFTATDPHGAKSALLVNITVLANIDPTLAALDQVDILAGESVSVQLDASDVDDAKSTLVYRLNSAPEGMQVSDTGLITWTTQSGTHSGEYTAEAVVTDPLGASASQQLKVVVNGVPTVNAVAPIVAKVGDQISVSVIATDPDGDELTYKELALPTGIKGSVPNGLKGKFIWTTKNAKDGSYSIDIEVADTSGNKAVVTVQITLEPVIVITLISAPTVSGSFTPEADAVIDEDAKTITIATVGGMRFYKLQSSDEMKLKITSIVIKEDKVLMSYKPAGE